MIKEKETPYIKMVIDDWLFIGEYKAGITIDLDVAKQVVKDRLVFTEGKSYPNLVVDTGVKEINKAARDYFSSEEGALCVNAGALLIKSKFSSMMINFFLQVNKPKIPTKTFTNKEKAIKWLEKYK